jgi:hypothetical protein
MIARLACGLAIAGALLYGSSASAKVIKTHGTGIVNGSSTIDTYGLFGVPGADLKGQPLSFSVTYDDTQFGSAANCGTDCLYYDTITGSSAKSVTISVTINEKTLSYRSKVLGQVLFDEYGFRDNSYAASADADLVAQSGTGVSLSVIYERPTNFGVRPKGPAYQFEYDYAEFYPKKHKDPELLNFFIPAP